MKINEKVKNSLITVQTNPVRNLTPSFTNFLKYGGKTQSKMKTGNKIHIKKKNRGKFTDYCGGNVTQACINRAKRSGSSTLRKRAVFAENARHWKHKNGGIIISDSFVELFLKSGGKLKNSMKIPGVIDSNPNLDNMKNDYVTKKKKKRNVRKTKITV